MPLDEANRHLYHLSTMYLSQKTSPKRHPNLGSSNTFIRGQQFVESPLYFYDLSGVCIHFLGLEYLAQDNLHALL